MNMRGKWILSHRKNTKFSREQVMWRLSRCTDFGNLHKKCSKMVFLSGILVHFIDFFQAFASSRAMRWYCDGVSPVMRLNDVTNVERDLKPTLSLMASMV